MLSVSVRLRSFLGIIALIGQEREQDWTSVHVLHELQDFTDGNLSCSVGSVKE